MITTNPIVLREIQNEQHSSKKSSALALITAIALAVIFILLQHDHTLHTPFSITAIVLSVLIIGGALLQLYSSSKKIAALLPQLIVRKPLSPPESSQQWLKEESIASVDQEKEVAEPLLRPPITKPSLPDAPNTVPSLASRETILTNIENSCNRLYSHYTDLRLYLPILAKALYGSIEELQIIEKQLQHAIRACSEKQQKQILVQKLKGVQQKITQSHNVHTHLDKLIEQISNIENAFAILFNKAQFKHNSIEIIHRIVTLSYTFVIKITEERKNEMVKEIGELTKKIDKNEKKLDKAFERALWMRQKTRKEQTVTLLDGDIRNILNFIKFLEKDYDSRAEGPFYLQQIFTDPAFSQPELHILTMSIPKIFISYIEELEEITVEEKILFDLFLSNEQLQKQLSPPARASESDLTHIREGTAETLNGIQKHVTALRVGGAMAAPFLKRKIKKEISKYIEEFLPAFNISLEDKKSFIAKINESVSAIFDIMIPLTVTSIEGLPASEVTERVATSTFYISWFVHNLFDLCRIETEKGFVGRTPTWEEAFEKLTTYLRPLQEELGQAHWHTHY